MSLDITITGLKQLESRINNLDAKIAVTLNKPETRHAVGQILIARARTTIKQGGNPLWTPIKKPTIDQRWALEQKKKPAKRVNKQGIVSNAPLMKSGIGMNSLNYDITKDGITLKAIKYMGYHQTGTKPYTIKPRNKKALNIPGIGPRKKVNHPGLPKRPFFIVLPEDIDDIRQIIIDDITAP